MNCLLKICRDEKFGADFDQTFFFEGSNDFEPGRVWRLHEISLNTHCSSAVHMPGRLLKRACYLHCWCVCVFFCVPHHLFAMKAGFGCLHADLGLRI